MEIQTGLAIVPDGGFRFDDGIVVSASIINHASGSLQGEEPILEDSSTKNQIVLHLYAEAEEKLKPIPVVSRDRYDEPLNGGEQMRQVKDYGIDFPLNT